MVYMCTIMCYKYSIRDIHTLYVTCILNHLSLQIGIEIYMMYMCTTMCYKYTIRDIHTLYVICISNHLNLQIEIVIYVYFMCQEYNYACMCTNDIKI